MKSASRDGLIGFISALVFALFGLSEYDHLVAWFPGLTNTLAGILAAELIFSVILSFLVFLIYNRFKSLSARSLGRFFLGNFLGYLGILLIALLAAFSWHGPTL